MIVDKNKLFRGKKRKQLTNGSWKRFKKIVEHRGKNVEVEIPILVTANGKFARTWLPQT